MSQTTCPLAIIPKMEMNFHPFRHMAYVSYMLKFQIQILRSLFCLVLNSAIWSNTPFSILFNRNEQHIFLLLTEIKISFLLTYLMERKKYFIGDWAKIDLSDKKVKNLML